MEFNSIFFLNKKLHKNIINLKIHIDCLIFKISIINIMVTNVRPKIF